MIVSGAVGEIRQSERRRIMRQERAAIAEELRRLVPQAVAAGLSAAEIASLTGMTRAGVYDTVKRAAS